MPTKGNMEAAMMILNMIQKKTGNYGKVDFFPQKPPAKLMPEVLQSFERVAPESTGVPSSLIRGLLRELKENKDIHMHRIMILKNSKVICECNFAPYRGDIWHITHSMCKSITGMAIGMLIDEGKLSLDEDIYEIFKEKVGLFKKVLRPQITVENLLTMQSGVKFNETGIVSEGGWLGNFLESSLNGKPGVTFQYNSMNSYVLSAIVTERTGQTLFEYLKSRLFTPLGIENVFWESSPEGISKGGFGLFMMAEDMAKLGTLYLQGGRWKDKQIIPKEWVKASTLGHSDMMDGDNRYGYHLWIDKNPDGFEYSGMLGQNVLVWPSLDMVIVVNAANRYLDQFNPMIDTIRRTFHEKYTSTDSLPENKASYLLLQSEIADLESGISGNKAIRNGGWKTKRRQAENTVSTAAMKQLFKDKYFDMEDRHVGVFPLVMQVLHNNMTDGVSNIGFEMEKEKFFLHLTEGDQRHRILLGFGKAELNEITEHGETYLAAAYGRMVMNIENEICLLVTICFLEEAMHRTLELTLMGDKLRAKWNETPGKDLIIKGLSGIMTDMDRNVLFHAFHNNGGTDALHTLMSEAIEPTTYGYLTGSSQDREEEVLGL